MQRGRRSHPAATDHLRPAKAIVRRVTVGLSHLPQATGHNRQETLAAQANTQNRRRHRRSSKAITVAIDAEAGRGAPRSNGEGR